MPNTWTIGRKCQRYVALDVERVLTLSASEDHVRDFRCQSNDTRIIIYYILYFPLFRAVAVYLLVSRRLKNV